MAFTSMPLRMRMELNPDRTVQRHLLAPPGRPGLLSHQEEVIVTEGPELRQSPQQATEPLRSPSCRSGLGPTHPGQ
ncbi:hypothetical protein INR49_022172 [Caranx melampygus]|nr:hypothetical protein INR49_022172 [Caranx melampygus]